VSKTLIRMVYLSKNLIQGDEADQEAEVDKILRSSRANNKRAGVTGALMFNSGYFAQVLEGPREGVETTFARIERDPRHGHVAILGNVEVEKREFGDWSMAYVQPPSERTEADWALTLQKAFLNPPNSQDEVLAMLRCLIGETV
jgi:hypothetical protein